MQKDRDALRVGLVTVVVIFLFFVVLMWISKDVGGPTQLIVARFASTPAMPTLAPGSAVLVGGQHVGRVVEARLDRQATPATATRPARENYYVVVEFEIRRDVLLRADCKVFAEGPPLGGDGVLKLDPGHADDGWPENRMLEGDDPGGFGAILAMLQGEFNGADPTSLLGQIKSQLDPNSDHSLVAKLLLSVNDINQVTTSLSRELGDRDKTALLGKLHEVMDHVNETTGALRREFAGESPTALLGKIHLAMNSINDGLDVIDRVLRAGEAPVQKTLVHVEATAEHLANETDASRADSLMAQLHTGSDRLNQALEDLDTITQTVRDVVVLNRDQLNRLIANFKEASDHLKTGVKYVLRHPWRVFNEPTQDESRQAAVFDAARSFTDAATRIDDAASRLKSLMDLHEGKIPVDDPDLAQLRKELEHTRTKYREAEAQLWKLLSVEP